MSIDSHQHEAHEDGEAWLISYADMMTLLFGLFVILYSMSQVDEAKFSEVRRELAETFGGEFIEKFGSEVGHLTETRQLRAFQMLVSMMNLGPDVESAVAKIEAQSKDSGSSDQSFQELKKDLKKKLADSKLGLLTGNEGDARTIDINIGESVLFRSGSYELKPGAATRLNELALELQRLAGVTRIEVLGHSDGHPASARYGVDNWALSSMRAASVARVLIASGVDRQGVRIGGMGDLEPLFPERRADGSWNEDNTARNRRVQIRVKRAAADEAR